VFVCLLVVVVPTSLVVLGTAALVIMSAFVLAGLFGPMPRYQIKNSNELPPNDTPEFLSLLDALADSKVNFIEEWQQRPLSERGPDSLGSIFERQQ